MFPHVKNAMQPTNISPVVSPRDSSGSSREAFQVKVHSELTTDIDYDHTVAMELKLKECSDEQLIAELARRKVDIQHKVTADLVAKYYHFEKLLGHGASGKVYLVYHRETGEKFACKVIKKDGSMNDAQSMSTEIEIMKRCRHLNIVSLYELFESSLCKWLILELVEGSGLRGGLLHHAHYTEQVCARFVRQICMGLHYLHNHGVIHRDVKIDNILLSVRGDGSGHDQTFVKITDFGLSAHIKHASKDYADDSGKRKTFTGLTEMWGTPTHYAPELIDRAYGPQADMWSLGCVIYEMLTGYEAYPSKEGMERKDLYANIKNAAYDKKRLIDLKISPEAQDLLSKIFQADPVARLSASECLMHPWVRGDGSNTDNHQHRLQSVYDAFNNTAPRSDADSSSVQSKQRNGLGAFAYLFGPYSPRK